jgi:hypothetical protein
MNYRQYLLMCMSAFMALPLASMQAGEHNDIEQSLVEYLKTGMIQHSFAYGPKEYAEADKLKNDLGDQYTNADLIKVAFSGNKEALFLLSLLKCIELEKLNSLETSQARESSELLHRKKELWNQRYLLLLYSASLGGAPALEELRLEFLNATGDSYNPYLHLIYTNICIKLGHSELIPYLQNALKILNSADHGKEAISEIDRITKENMEIIHGNCEKLKSSKDQLFCLTLNLIYREDIGYTMNYWHKMLKIDDYESRKA